MTATLLEMPGTNTPPPARKPMRDYGTWLEVLSHLDRSYGGLSTVVPALSAQLHQRLGISTQLAAFCAPGEDTSGTPVPASVWPAGHMQWLLSSGLQKRYAAAMSACNGVHIHGLWEASATWTATVARRAKKPYVVSAHGMLEPWALAQKATKKRVYGALVERQTLQGAAFLHALTSAEAGDYRRFGCTRPIAVIPNAVEAPASIQADLIETMFPVMAGRPVVLFLGRLHGKKGIELLLKAWVSVRAEHPDALLMLAGPGEESYVKTLRSRATELGLAQDVLFAGMLHGGAKWSALARAHVFVLPSYSEGLSVATLEALCAGTPVIVTEACHLPEVTQAECGWQIATAIPPLEQALRASLGSSRAERLEMGDRARKLAGSRFSWRVVCEQMAELYGCVLDGSQPHTFLHMEATR